MNFCNDITYQATVQGDDVFGDLLGSNCITARRNDNLAVALDLAAQGRPVFPCSPAKRPKIRDWSRSATTNPQRVRAWWSKWPDALPGLPTGERSGLAVLDLDRHHAGQDGVAALATLGHDPASLSPSMVETPSGGRHLYFAHVTGLTNAGVHLPDGVDVRGQGGYVIAPGAKLPDGRVYGSADLIALPEFPASLRPAPRQLREDDLFGDLLAAPAPVDRDRLKSALLAITDADDRDNWLRIGMALHHEGRGADWAYQLWETWSQQSRKFDFRDQRRTWQRFGRKRGVTVTGATIVGLAYECGWNPTDVDAEFEDVEDEAASEIGTPTTRLTFLSPADCEMASSRAYVIKGLLAEGDVACVFGAPGAGKSLLTPFLGYAVAQGREAFGMRTKPGKVFYVAAEDPHGMRGRVKALRSAHGDAPDFQLVEGVSNLLVDKSPDLKALLQAVRALRPKLVIVDTLAMAFPGLEENSAEAMGRVVAVARSLTEWGASVILVHHDTKAEGATPRGHSLLNGALDVAIHVKRDEGGIIRGKLTKNRNGSCDRDIAFRIAVEDGGLDEDGDKITLPRCDALSGDDDLPPVRLTRSETAVMVHFDQIANGDHVSEQELRQTCVDGRNVSPSDNRDSRTKAYVRAMSGLIDKGKLVYRNGWYVLPGGVEEDFDDMPDDLGPHRYGQNPDMSGMSGSAKRLRARTDTDTPLKGCPMSGPDASLSVEIGSALSNGC